MEIILIEKKSYYFFFFFGLFSFIKENWKKMIFAIYGFKLKLKGKVFMNWKNIISELRYKRLRNVFVFNDFF